MSDFGEELFCSGQWVDDNSQGGSFLAVFFKCLTSLHIFLTITATLGNSLILVALHRDSSLHPPSKLLLRSLTITDLCSGLISQPMTITYISSALTGNSELCRVSEYSAYVVTTICSGVSLSTLTAIGVDRLLALLLGLRYRQVVTVKRVCMAVALFWIEGSVVGILYLRSAQLYFIVSGVSVALKVVISTYSYTRIFRTIRRQQAQVQDNLAGQTNSAPNLARMARYKRTVLNALWVHLTLAACYLPFAVVTAVIATRGLNTSLFLAEGIAVTFVFLNSSLNPVLYCWKVREVRQAAKETVRKLCPCFAT